MNGLLGDHQAEDHSRADALLLHTAGRQEARHNRSGIARVCAEEGGEVKG